MNITVILCTYNRCRSLLKTLDSVAASTLPDSVRWEVLVVDNNSSDQTPEVVEEFCQQHRGRFRYIFERRQGKSHALNTGIQEARGDVFAFMDDDVTVDPDWLQNLTASLQGDEWAGAGGRILPEGNFSPPRWLALNGPYAMRGALVLFDLGGRPGRLDCAPWGTNMAFRRVMFEKYGGFRTDLGPRPGSEIRNEDTEFGRRLMARGEHLWYAPSAVVYHAVPENRIKKKFFLQWWFDHGRADIREDSKRCDSWHLGIPHAIRGMLSVTLRWLLALSSQRRFYFKTQIWLAAGQIVEAYRQRQSGPTKQTNTRNA
jgi:glycosyltransferase involved in cell wall biosynthesis